MIATALPDLTELFEGRFRTLLETDWASWREAYIAQVRAVQEADEQTWSRPDFQQRLWDDASVSSIGPGQSVTVVSAYDDRELAAPGGDLHVRQCALGTQRAAGTGE